VVAFGIFYGVQQWSPTGEFARTPGRVNDFETTWFNDLL
jgi:hypothetical protein